MTHRPVLRPAEVVLSGTDHTDAFNLKCWNQVKFVLLEFVDCFESY